MRLRMAYAILLAAGAGCATYRTERGPAPDPNVLTHTQLMSNHFQSAYEAVLSLRANWLQGRSPHLAGGGVQVYLDDVRLGGIEWLHVVNIQTVSYIRRQNSSDPTAPWGPGQAPSVIYISTHPVIFAGRAK